MTKPPHVHLSCHSELDSESINADKNILTSGVQNDKSSRKAAFTMAEVLITLGIIGIVAAMTLPSLIGKYQKQVTVSKLQKVYTTLNQALERSEVDHEDYKYWPSGFDIGAENYFNEYWKPYLNVVHVCKTYKDCGFNISQPWTQLNNTKFDFSVVAAPARTAFYLPDGVLVLIITAGYNPEGIANEADWIIVDVNGGKNPNRIGRDVFMFSKTSEKSAKGILPYGYDKTPVEIAASCSKNGNGRYCSAKIIGDGWQIKPDYPW